MERTGAGRAGCRSVGERVVYGNGEGWCSERGQRMWVNVGRGWMEFGAGKVGSTARERWGRVDAVTVMLYP